MMREKKKKKNMKILLICLIILCLIGGVPFLMIKMCKSTHIHAPNGQHVYKFYDEPEDTLDGIYLGSSAADKFWLPTEAFDRSGIAIYNLGTTNQPFVTTKYIIEEALKTQKDMDVILIEIRCLVRPVRKTSEEFVKIWTDVMPFSKNRSAMIKRYLEYNKEAGADIDYSPNDYYFPVGRNHMEWIKKFNLGDFALLFADTERLHSYKGYPKDHLTFLIEPQKNPKPFTESEPLEPIKEEMFQDLLDYCKTLDAKVIFVSAPFLYLKSGIEQTTYVLDRCEEEGFDTLNFNCEPLQSEIDLDWKHDFYNYKHTNYWGAVKFTDFMTDYLVQNYDLPDHRGDPKYDSWVERSDDLHEVVEEYEATMQQGQ